MEVVRALETVPNDFGGSREEVEETRIACLRNMRIVG
jgi:hypothetical protein